MVAKQWLGHSRTYKNYMPTTVYIKHLSCEERNDVAATVDTLVTTHLQMPLVRSHQRISNSKSCRDNPHIIVIPKIVLPRALKCKYAIDHIPSNAGGACNVSSGNRTILIPI